nr:coatomer subunit gamma [Quercus suber]
MFENETADVQQTISSTRYFMTKWRIELDEGQSVRKGCYSWHSSNEENNLLSTIREALYEAWKQGFREVDPTTGETEDDGVEDEYHLEDLEVVAADYMLKVGVSNFRNAWESMGDDCLPCIILLLFSEMAVDLYSESSNMGTSPRISFSHDFCQSDNIIPVEQHPPRSKSTGLSSGIDFDFCVRESFEQESSSADELFSDGKIVPAEIKKKVTRTKQIDQYVSHPPLPPPRSTSDSSTTKQESSKESKGSSNEADGKQSSKSFWRFKRSSSSGSGYGRSLCPLPPLLSRSNSTGSVPNAKRAPFSNDGSNSKQSSHKHSSMKASQSSAPSSYLKPPLKKEDRDKEALEGRDKEWHNSKAHALDTR